MQVWHRSYVVLPSHAQHSEFKRH